MKFRPLLPALALAVIALPLYGCASNRLAVDAAAPESPALRAMNEQLQGETALVLFLDGRRETGRDVTVRPDSTVWASFSTREHRAALTSSIHAIEASVFETPPVARRGTAIGFAAAAIAAGLLLELIGDTGLPQPAEVGIALGAGAVGGYIGARREGRQGAEGNRVGRFILNPRRN